MCGICGIYNFNGEPIDRELLDRMSSIIRHRGPDGEGSYVSGDIGLGHRRLSIIDIEGEAQPITNEDKSMYLIFNGEIYNFIELREDLEKKGHSFKTRSDTEVIIHGFEEWGTECVNHFNGIFAFALWDCNSKKLFLARDHLGVKPLYYIVLRNKLLFALEIKSLLQDKDCLRQVDIKSLEQLFTFRYVPSPNTLFKGIKKLPPGHWMLCSSDSIEIKRYWNWRPQIINNREEDELIEQYQTLLEDSIKLQLRSDVPVGLFLSSGIDSNTILAIMSNHTTSPVYTFTIGFEDGNKTNETDDAREMAKRFGTKHAEMIVSPEDYEKYYQYYLWNIEEPVGNETAAAFYFVSKIASEKVKVVLTGQGADEPWAGYDRYIGVKLSNLYSKLPHRFSEYMKRLISVLPRNERLKRGVLSLNEPDVLTRFAKIYSFYSDEMKGRLFRDWVKEEMSADYHEPKEAIRHLQSDVRNLDPVTQMLYIDTRSNLPDDLLMVNDKTSMANSIEARVPYLDYRLIEFIESIPSNLKLKGFQGKYLHKKAVEKWLPREMIYRKKKGFANPIDQWLRGKMYSYINESLLQNDSGVNMYFNKDYIKQIIHLHKQRKEAHRRHIYLLLSFELWYQRFIKNGSQ
jgi:asparagine synthase (glutamine-hydrolysing)